LNKAAAQAILKHIGSALEKLDRRGRAQRLHRQRIRRYQSKIRKASLEFFNYLYSEISPGLRRLTGRTPTEMVRNLADWKVVKEEGRKIFNAPLAEIAATSATMIRKHSIFKQEREDPLGQAATSWANKHSAELVTLITEETMMAIRSAIKSGIDQGLSIGEISREVRPLIGLNERQAVAVSRYATKLHEAGLPEDAVESRLTRYMRKAHNYRSVMIARTETASALLEGQIIGYKDMGIKKLQRIEDPECCDVCAEADGRIYDIDEAEGVLPEHPNCLPGDSLILPGGRITALSKRWYKGQMTVIQTASGRKLRMTPNHPVLTGSGIRPANSLNIGDRIICQGLGQRKSFTDWKNQYAPATIEEIANSFIESGRMTTIKMKTSPEDFHGDGIGSEITIIGADRFLESGSYTSFLEHFLKYQLIMGTVFYRIFFPRFRCFLQRLKENITSPSSLMSSPYLIFSLLWAHLLPAETSHFASSAKLHSSLEQTVSYSSPADTVSLANFTQSMARTVLLDNFLHRQSITDKSTFQISGPFFLDQITHIKMAPFEGYVYNLETTQSYYIANGIATHNCEGTWVAAF